jgi:hypothetical protein
LIVAKNDSAMRHIRQLRRNDAELVLSARRAPTEKRYDSARARSLSAVHYEVKDRTVATRTTLRDS